MHPPKKLIPAIEKAIDETSAKLYRTKAVIADLKSQPELLPFSFISPVPVYSTGGKWVGFAALHDDEFNINAEVVLDYACPERLDLEVGCRDWYLVPAIKVSEGISHIVGLYFVESPPEGISLPRVGRML